MADLLFIFWIQLLCFNYQQIYLFGQIQISQTGAQLYKRYFPLWWGFSAYSLLAPAKLPAFSSLPAWIAYLFELSY